MVFFFYVLCFALGGLQYQDDVKIFEKCSEIISISARNNNLSNLSGSRCVLYYRDYRAITLRISYPILFCGWDSFRQSIHPSIRRGLDSYGRFRMIVHNFDHRSAIVGGHWCSDKPYIRDAPGLFLQKEASRFPGAWFSSGQRKRLLLSNDLDNRPSFREISLSLIAVRTKKPLPLHSLHPTAGLRNWLR